ncbi:hypothetical protein FOMPIDRAFT_64676 [Fomitopsis schrenkii]|uniref:BED-type domain-containing protein n=1 Tax=Fomitopsis schrenkii TaxID=2126942 RepID=S8DK64_FOMSC|nr:hypothetical protein FOMPIDRAFT_64676 [Fomitopsis schrenkii]
MIVGRLQKRWTAPVYAFFKPNVSIEYIKGRCVHVFRCANTGCKQQVRRYHGTGDTKSTGNLRKHVKSCWGAEALHAADLKDSAVNAQDAVRTYRRTHDIKVAFGNVGKKTVSFSTRQHTPSETRAEIVRWVSESMRPFNIVKDRGFVLLMKTGRPEYAIPSPTTVGRDVRKVFTRVRERVARMLKVCTW